MPFLWRLLLVLLDPREVKKSLVVKLSRRKSELQSMSVCMSLESTHVPWFIKNVLILNQPWIESVSK